MKRYQLCPFKAGLSIARRNAILAVVPDRGVARDGHRDYTKVKDPWIIGLVPDGGPSDSLATSNCRFGAEECSEIIDGFMWHHQHGSLCLLSELMVCVGFSCATVVEIARTKWVGGPRVIAMRRGFVAGIFSGDGSWKNGNGSFEYLSLYIPTDGLVQRFDGISAAAGWAFRRCSYFAGLLCRVGVPDELPLARHPGVGSRSIFLGWAPPFSAPFPRSEIWRDNDAVGDQSHRGSRR